MENFNFKCSILAILIPNTPSNVNNYSSSSSPSSTADVEKSTKKHLSAKV